MKSDAKVAIEPATSGDWPAIIELLRSAGLSGDDLATAAVRFLVARAPGAGNCAGTIAGVVGAEVCGAEGLLRSLAVSPELRGAGIGTRLVDAIDVVANDWGVARWWLLTTTAEKFFVARGFRIASRSDAPAAIRGTGQFSGGCCASAVCLSRLRKAAG